MSGGMTNELLKYTSFLAALLISDYKSLWIENKKILLTIVLGEAQHVRLEDISTFRKYFTYIMEDILKGMILTDIIFNNISLVDIHAANTDN